MLRIKLAFVSFKIGQPFMFMRLKAGETHFKVVEECLFLCRFIKAYLSPALNALFYVGTRTNSTSIVHE